ncbi:MAG TPA: class I SAM-dependent methyltransferase [Kofleriaceae bacterium]|nr:class I SAM-dependent methyltransferase [Kofleriaceae bacterium]
MLDAARRLEIGQWFTPPAVADLALALALPRDRRVRLLDPACGDGVFLARAAAAGVHDVTGVDLDPAAAAAARTAAPGASISCGDLFDLDGAFDVVVGNPPYVRQERLGPARKAIARQRLLADWPDLPRSDLERLVGRADLAAAVVARSLRLCRPGGRVALVLSSALLDADYGAPLWRLVTRHAAILAIIDAPRERWFPDAAVNALILVMERTSTITSTGTITIARLNVSTEEASRRVTSTADLASVADLAHAPAGDPSAWAAALRAPRAWLDFAAAAPLVPLAELADVRRGITSGANDVFYLPRARAAELEPEVTAPLLRSPRQAGATRIAVDPAALDTVALVAPADLARFPRARRYVERHAAVAVRPTLRHRDPWWTLSARPARLFLTKAYAARFVQRFSPAPVVADQRLYSLHPRAGVDDAALAAVLNATTTALALEALGRASLGEGALEWTVADAARLPVIDPRALGPAAAAALAVLARRPIGSVADERDRPDRARLDRAVAGRAVDLLPAMHDALCDSVARRAARARSA